MGQMKPKPKPRAKRKSQVVPNDVAEEQEFIQKLKAAFNADLSQFFTDSLTPDRGYSTSIDNLKKLFHTLRKENATLPQTIARKAIEDAPHNGDCDFLWGDDLACTCWKSRALASIDALAAKTP